MGIIWECVPSGEVLRDPDSGEPSMVNDGLARPGGICAMAGFSDAQADGEKKNATQNADGTRSLVRCLVW